MLTTGSSPDVRESECSELVGQRSPGWRRDTRASGPSQ
jgi:hypothetical protein